MFVSLIICTYQRKESLLRLLDSVQKQSLYPNEILVIDGSLDSETEIALKDLVYPKLSFYKVDKNNRGLTKQRNFGIEKLNIDSEIVCFLDDDTVLHKDYFKNIKERFETDQSITGIGGLATNENRWKPIINSFKYHSKLHKVIDGYYVEEGFRNVLRNYLGLGANQLPGIMPAFSHGNSYGYPLTGKAYEVDLLIGMSMSFRKKVVNEIKFSTYFEGYGLYEDADFSLRAQQFGKNVLDTQVLLEHHHHPSGRPNYFKYGKIVVRNGWYVWRIKYKNPNFINQLKWHSTSLLLTLIRLTNTFGKDGKSAFFEFTGRVFGWVSLLFNKPKLES